MEINKCTDGVYVSGQWPAGNFYQLKELGITHVVNVATGVECFFPAHFTYHHIQGVADYPSQDIRQYFDATLDFMRNAVEGGGKVLVHCNLGISRSVTLVIAYIMKYERKTLSESFQQVESARPIIFPNGGFVAQLEQFEKELEALQGLENATERINCQVI